MREHASPAGCLTKRLAQANAKQKVIAYPWSGAVTFCL